MSFFYSQARATDQGQCVGPSFSYSCATKAVELRGTQPHYVTTHGRQVGVYPLFHRPQRIPFETQARMETGAWGLASGGSAFRLLRANTPHHPSDATVCDRTPVRKALGARICHQVIKHGIVCQEDENSTKQSHTTVVWD